MDTTSRHAPTRSTITFLVGLATFAAGLTLVLTFCVVCLRPATVTA